jgi:hypothetical protein
VYKSRLVAGLAQPPTLQETVDRLRQLGYIE